MLYSQTLQIHVQTKNIFQTGVGGVGVGALGAPAGPGSAFDYTFTILVHPSLVAITIYSQFVCMPGSTEEIKKKEISHFHDMTYMATS